MHRVDLTFVLAIISLLVTVVTVFLNTALFRFEKRKKSDRSSTIKYIPLLLVGFTLSAVLMINEYYQTQTAKEQALLLTLKKRKFDLDTSSFTSKEKLLLLDSLSIYKDKLSEIINRLEKQKRITGKGNGTIAQAQVVLNKTDEQIADVESYNEIIAVPQNYTNEYMAVRSSEIEFECPPKSSSNYVDVNLNLHNKKLVSSIRFIYVSVTEKTKEQNHENLIFQQAYLAKLGLNKIRMKNYFNNSNIGIQIGYFIKNDSVKKAPTFHFVSCGNL